MGVKETLSMVFFYQCHQGVIFGQGKFLIFICNSINAKIHVLVKHDAPTGNEVQKPIFSTKVKVKVTRSLVLVSFESASFVEDAC